MNAIRYASIPWIRDSSKASGCWIRAADGQPVALATGDTDEATEAHADLIVLLPDLLDACLAMIRWDDAEKNAKPFDEDNGGGFYARMAMCDEAFQKARDVIAKAERV